MKAEQFIKEYEKKFLEYCPCIIDENGDILECADGHLKALLAMFQSMFPKEEIPNHVSPMFYCIVKMHAIVVDFENQVYSDQLNANQKRALAMLADHHMIEMHLCDIHGSYELPKSE